MKADVSPGRNIRILRWAWGVGAFVLVAGLLVIVAPAVRHAGSLFDDPFVGQVQRRTVETFDAAGRLTGTEVTTAPAGSWLERSLGPGGVLLLRMAVVAVAAFMAGALVYRTATGSFPSEIAGVIFADKTGAGLDELTGTVATLIARVEGLYADVERLREAVTEGAHAVADLDERLDVTREQSGRIEASLLDISSQLSAAIADVDALRSRRRAPKAQ
jgi:outer membrane murein-binding lipoprotein Lpp